MSDGQVGHGEQGDGGDGEGRSDTREASRTGARASTSMPMPRARPSIRTGTARVLERSARAAPDVVSPTMKSMNGDGSSIGWTPTPRITPVTIRAMA